MSNYDYYRGSSSYEDAVKNRLNALAVTGAATTHAVRSMESELRDEMRAGINAIHDLQDMYIAGTNATLNMQQGIRNDIQTNTNMIQDMAFGLRSDIRESTYALVASQTMLAQSFQHGFNALANTLNLTFGMVSNKLDAMSDLICSKLDEIHDILNNPRLTESRELYRNALTSYEKGFYEEALEDCRAAVEKNKTDFISWHLLGHIYLFGAGKFSNVIDIDKAEEAFFNASKYIDPDIGHSEEANTLASEIYYYLGYSRLVKSNDLLIENKNEDSVKKLEEAEKASREASRLSNKNLFAVYEQAKELHFLEKDGEALNLLEQLIRTDKNYALKAVNDKNFESMWQKIDELIINLRNEVTNEILKQCNMIRTVWKRELEFRQNQLVSLELPDENLITNFEVFYNTELIKQDFDWEKNLVRSICDDFNELVRENFYGRHCQGQDAITCNAVIQNVRNGMAGLQSKLDKSISIIDGILLPFEAELNKDYFFVLEKQKEFNGSQNQNRLKQIADEIRNMLSEFDENISELCKDIDTMRVYIAAQSAWPERESKLRNEYVKKIKVHCDELLASGKDKIEELKNELEYKERDEDRYIKDCRKFGIKARSACKNWEGRLDAQKRNNATAVEELKVFLINTVRNAEKILDKDYFTVLAFWSDINNKVDYVWTHEFSQKRQLCVEEMQIAISDIKNSINQFLQKAEDRRVKRAEKREVLKTHILFLFLSIICLTIVPFAIVHDEYLGNLSVAFLHKEDLFFVNGHQFCSAVLFILREILLILSGLAGSVILGVNAVFFFYTGHPVLGVITSLAVLVSIGVYTYEKNSCLPIVEISRPTAESIKLFIVALIVSVILLVIAVKIEKNHDALCVILTLLSCICSFSTGMVGVSVWTIACGGCFYSGHPVLGIFLALIACGVFATRKHIVES